METTSSKAVRELLDVLRRVCGGLPGAQEYVMVHHPAFRVGKKPFAIAGMDEATSGPTLSVNLGKDAQVGLLDDARFARTHYIGQHGWVTIDSRRLRKGELETLVVESYRRVATKTQLAALASARPKERLKAPRR